MVSEDAAAVFCGLPNMQSVLNGRFTVPHEEITDEAILALQD